MSQIAKEFNVKVTVTADQDTLVVGQDGLLSLNESKSILESLDKCIKEVKQNIKESIPPETESLEESLKNHINQNYSNQSNLLSTLIQTIEVGAGIPLNQISSKYFGFHQSFSGSDGLPIGGYQEIVNQIEKKLNQFEIQVILNSEVKKLMYDQVQSKVKLEVFDQLKFKTELYQTQFCISTIPLGVLKTNSPEFRPPLESSTKLSIENTSVGLLNKIVLQYDQAWWPNSKSIGRYIFTSIQDSKLDIKQKNALIDIFSMTTFWVDNLNVENDKESCPILIIPIGALAAKEIEKFSNEEIIKSLHEYLIQRFGSSNQVSNLPNSSIITRWESNPYSHGATSSPIRIQDQVKSDSIGPNPSPSPLDLILLSRSNWDGHLGFAGEHTEIDHRGSVAGAILSGKREAKRVIRLLNLNQPDQMESR
ncbi:amine oxidase [Melampsora americana]|nr:amine oxidase [Melampsora americana]